VSDENVLGVTFEARCLQEAESGLSIGFALSMGGFEDTFSDTQAGAVLTDSYTIAAYVGGRHMVPPAATATDLPGAGTTVGSLEYELDLEALCLGAGVVAMYQWEGLGVVLALGPTLTYAQVDVEATETVNWSDTVLNTPGARIYRSTRDDDKKDLILGAYGSIGVEYRINENWKAGLEYRYDAAFNDVDTSLADVDLSGVSGTVKLIYSF